MAMCIVCHKRKATVPDRNTGSRQKKLCSECHESRLRNDMAGILVLEAEKDCSNETNYYDELPGCGYWSDYTPGEELS